VLVHAAISGLGPESDVMVKDIMDRIEEKENRELIAGAVMEALALKDFGDEFEFTVNAWTNIAPSALVRDSSADGADATSPTVPMTPINGSNDPQPLMPTEKEQCPRRGERARICGLSSLAVASGQMLPEPVPTTMQREDDEKEPLSERRNERK